MSNRIIAQKIVDFYSVSANFLKYKMCIRDSTNNDEQKIREYCTLIQGEAVEFGNVLENDGLQWSNIIKKLEVISEVCYQLVVKQIDINLFVSIMNYTLFLLDYFGGDVYKRQILYGAGAVGVDYYRQLCAEIGEKHIKWTDKKWYEINNRIEEVISVDIAFESNYDKVLIAVKEETIVKQIKQELIEFGVEENKILWKTPIILKNL